jgi:hypothetical protein
MSTDSKYIEVPILRGFTEIQWLWDRIELSGIIAGGYARYCCSQRTDISYPGDVDIFPYNDIQFDLIKSKLAFHGFQIQHENDVSISYKSYTAKNDSVDELQKSALPPVQLIKPVTKGRILTFGKAEEILDNFDFTVTRAAIVSTAHGTACIVDADFIQDDLDGVLSLRHIHCPISSTIRCIKYAKKGYKLPVKEALKLFQDWMDRTPAYREGIIDFFKKENPTPDEAEQMYALMKVD